MAKNYAKGIWLDAESSTKPLTVPRDVFIVTVSLSQCATAANNEMPMERKCLRTPMLERGKVRESTAEWNLFFGQIYSVTHSRTSLSLAANFFGFVEHVWVSEWVKFTKLSTDRWSCRQPKKNARSPLSQENARCTSLFKLLGWGWKVGYYSILANPGTKNVEQERGCF